MKKRRKLLGLAMAVSLLLYTMIPMISMAEGEKLAKADTIVQVNTELELRNAVADADGPVTIELTEDITMTDPYPNHPGGLPSPYAAMANSQYASLRAALYIAIGKEITLTGDHSLIGTENNGNVIVVDGKLTLDGPTIMHKAGLENTCGIRCFFENQRPDGASLPELIFKSGNVCNNRSIGIAVGNAKMKMTGGNVYQNGSQTSSAGGGIGVGSSVSYPADVTISGGNIYNNTANAGAGVHLSAGGNDATLTIIGGNIYDNHAVNYPVNGTVVGGHGGGIYVSGYNAGSLNITGGNIYNNEADRYGGGVYSNNYDTLPLAISGGKIYGNKAEYGGGLFSWKAPVNISGGEIYENDARYGGGIYGKAVNISDKTKIYENTASQGGGIATFTAAELAMSGGEIYDNTATYGGGIYNAGALTLTGGKISDNTSINPADGEYTSGGGVYTVSYNNLNIGENVEFSGNKANKLTSLQESDEEFAIYKTNIKVPDGKWSVAGVKYGYNNYDINYQGPEITLNETETQPATNNPTVTSTNKPELQGAEDESQVVNTGDESNISFILILMLTAFIIGVVTFALKRRNYH